MLKSPARRWFMRSVATAASSAFQTNIVRNLRIAGIVLAALTILGGGIAIWDMRQREIDDAKGDMRNLGMVLASQASGSIQMIDSLLREIQTRSNDLGIRTSDEFRQRLGGSAIQQFLRERLKNLPQARATGLFDAEGVLVNSSRDAPIANYSIADRDYYQYVRDHPEDAVFVSLPAKDRGTGPVSVFLVRRVAGPDGAFLGLAVASVNLESLLEFYRSISEERGIAVTLLRRDGTMLARYPPMAINGRSVPIGSQWHTRVAAGGGTYISEGHFSGMRSIVSAHPLRDYPLVIDVSIHEQDVLELWRQQAALTAGGAIVLAAVFVALFFSSARKISEQKAHEDRLSDFAELASDWFWEQDRDLRFTDVGLGAPLRTPVDRSYVGKQRWELNDITRDPQRWEAHRRDMLAHRKFVDFRYNRTGADGRMHYVSISGVPVHDRSGAFAGYRGIGRDITADVEAAEALRIAKEQAEAANRAKSEFLSNMRHELCTPLHAIIGFSELIQDQKIDRNGANHAAWASDILASGRHLLAIINDVLELSRIDAGRYGLADDRVDLAVVTRDCLRAIRAQAEEKQVGLDFAPQDVDALLRADSRAIKQIILNLVTNALKFTREGGTVSIRIECASNHDLVLLVADTGIGIDPAMLASLFEPFTQADASMTRNYGGTGLGLAISRRLVALHGGTLTIESALGQGTTARAAFPAERVLARQSPARAVG
jgi:signal transduction histidine kinase